MKVSLLNLNLSSNIVREIQEPIEGSWSNLTNHFTRITRKSVLRSSMECQEQKKFIISFYFNNCEGREATLVLQSGYFNSSGKFVFWIYDKI